MLSSPKYKEDIKNIGGVKRKDLFKKDILAVTFLLSNLFMFYVGGQLGKQESYEELNRSSLTHYEFNDKNFYVLNHPRDENQVYFQIDSGFRKDSILHIDRIRKDVAFNSYELEFVERLKDNYLK